MTPVKQTILHDPENGKFGNCAQAAFASLLDMDINDVPHFADGLTKENDGGVFNKRVNDWLAVQGLGYFSVAIYPEHLKSWQEYVSNVCNHHLISGRTERGTYHVVVGKNGEVTHDPHPSDSGLLPPTNDEPWLFEFVIKRN